MVVIKCLLWSGALPVTVNGVCNAALTRLVTQMIILLSELYSVFELLV